MTDATLLFERIVDVKIGPKAGGTFRIFTDLRIQFEVTKTSEKAPNRGLVKIFNLNQESRAVVENKNEKQLKLVKESSKKAEEINLKSLKSENEKLNSKIKELENEKKKSLVKIESLEKQENDIKAEFNQAKSELKKLSTENKELEKTIPISISNATKILKEEINQLKNKIDVQSNTIKFHYVLQ